MTHLGTDHTIAQFPFSQRHHHFSSPFRVAGINGLRPASTMTANAKSAPVGDILIATADLADQRQLHQALAAIGYTVRSLSSEQNVLQVVQASKPDVLLISTQLPEGSGFDLCTQLKADPATASTLVIFTGPPEPKNDCLKAFAAGAIDFLPQPIWPEELVARLQTHLTHDRVYRRFQAQAQRALSASSPSPLLATLQRTLHRQTSKLQEKNQLLETEIQERQEMEEALRREQQKSEQLLLNILPQAIVTQLKQFQGSLAERFEKATVLFADIVDFTTMATVMRPLELVDMHNQIFSAFDRLA